MKKYILMFALAAFAVSANAGEDCAKNAAACDGSKAKVASAKTCSAEQSACCATQSKKVVYKAKATAKGAYNRG
jgi:hypothetical protein